MSRRSQLKRIRDEVRLHSIEKYPGDPVAQLQEEQDEIWDKLEAHDKKLFQFAIFQTAVTTAVSVVSFLAGIGVSLLAIFWKK